MRGKIKHRTWYSIFSFLAIRLALLICFISIVVGVVAFARGYRFDINNNTLTSTGILAISANPKAAKVYLNNELKGVSDINLTLPPGTYKIDIKKEGYTTWTKSVELKGELVLSIDAMLFPLNPSLSPLTNLGINKTIPVDNTGRIILVSNSSDETRSGIYMFGLENNPLSLLPPLKPIVLKKTLPSWIDITSLNVIFSPDFKQAIFTFSPLDSSQKATFSSLVSLEEENKQPFDVTGSTDSLFGAWQEEKESNRLKLMEAFPSDIRHIASSSMKIVAVSPDETKILYQATASAALASIIKPPLIAADQSPQQRTIKAFNLYVYDKKEDRNYLLISSSDWIKGLHDSDSYDDSKKNTDEYYIYWYYDSRRLIFNEHKKITAIDYDGQNKQTVYSGPFENSLFSLSSDGRVVILANLNPDSNLFPDLYQVGIR